MVKLLAGHAAAVVSVAVFADSKLVITGIIGIFDVSAKIWDVGTDYLLAMLAGHAADVVSLTVFADSVHVSTGIIWIFDGTAKIWR